MKTVNMQKTIAVALALGVLGISHAASAQDFNIVSGVSHDPDRQVNQTRLSFADVDVSSVAGARVVLGRIERAAVAVCGGRPDIAATTSDREDFAACFKDARSGAVRQAHAPVLTALANNEHGLFLARN